MAREASQTLIRQGPAGAEAGAEIWRRAGSAASFQVMRVCTGCGHLVGIDQAAAQGCTSVAETG